MLTMLNEIKDKLENICRNQKTIKSDLTNLRKKQRELPEMKNNVPEILECSGKKQIYVCITESLCCTPETNTTLLINYTSIKNNNNKMQWKIRLKRQPVNWQVDQR